MVEVLTLIGIAGAVILAIAWIPETLEIIRLKESKLNRKFAEVYFIGTLLLFLYALYLKDAIFAFVNGFILFQVCISLYYEFVVEPKTKKKR